MPAYRPLRAVLPSTVAPTPVKAASPTRKIAGGYHGQGKIGSVPRTQFYLASSGDYTPDALKQIYRTPTTTTMDLGRDENGLVGGEYDPKSDSVKLRASLPPLWSDFVARHEYGHMFDIDRTAKTPIPVHNSLSGVLRRAFDNAGNTVQYYAAKDSDSELRASIAAEPWLYRGVSEHFPEFTPQVWTKQQAPINQRWNERRTPYIGARLVSQIASNMPTYRPVP